MTETTDSSNAITRWNKITTKQTGNTRGRDKTISAKKNLLEEVVRFLYTTDAVEFWKEIISTNNALTMIMSQLRGTLINSLEKNQVAPFILDKQPLKPRYLLIDRSTITNHKSLATNQNLPLTSKYSLIRNPLVNLTSVFELKVILIWQWFWGCRSSWTHRKTYKLLTNLQISLVVHFNFNVQWNLQPKSFQ